MRFVRFFGCKLSLQVIHLQLCSVYFLLYVLLLLSGCLILTLALQSCLAVFVPANYRNNNEAEEDGDAEEVVFVHEYMLLERALKIKGG